MELYAKCYLNNLSKRWSQTDIKTIAFYTHLSHLFPLAQWENNSFNKLKAPPGTHCLAPMNCPVKTFTYLSLNSSKIQCYLQNSVYISTILNVVCSAAYHAKMSSPLLKGWTFCLMGRSAEEDQVTTVGIRFFSLQLMKNPLVPTEWHSNTYLLNTNAFCGKIQYLFYLPVNRIGQFSDAMFLCGPSNPV